MALRLFDRNLEYEYGKVVTPREAKRAIRGLVRDHRFTNSEKPPLEIAAEALFDTYFPSIIYRDAIGVIHRQLLRWVLTDYDTITDDIYVIGKHAKDPDIETTLRYHFFKGIPLIHFAPATTVAVHFNVRTDDIDFEPQLPVGIEGFLIRKGLWRSRDEPQFELMKQHYVTSISLVGKAKDPETVPWMQEVGRIEPKIIQTHPYDTELVRTEREHLKPFVDEMCAQLAFRIEQYQQREEGKRKARRINLYGRALKNLHRHLKPDVRH